jgi:hypothetical protein
MNQSELEKLVKEGHFKNKILAGEIVLEKEGDDIIYVGKIIEINEEFSFKRVKSYFTYVLRKKEDFDKITDGIEPGQKLHTGLGSKYARFFEICDN